jgi:hypothetical protein
MKLPGFTAEASLQNRSQLYLGFVTDSVINTDKVVHPAQSFIPWSGSRPIPIPIVCPPGLVPWLVPIEGEWRCTRWKWNCYKEPFHVCRRDCAEEEWFPTKYGWECQLATV